MDTYLKDRIISEWVNVCAAITLKLCQPHVCLLNWVAVEQLDKWQVDLTVMARRPKQILTCLQIQKVDYWLNTSYYHCELVT